MKRRALTILELLLVVVIIGLLIAILLPSISTTHSPARKTRCAVNLRTIFEGLRTYTVENSGILPDVADAAWLTDQSPIMTIRITNGKAPKSPFQPFYCPYGPELDPNPATRSFSIWGYAVLNNRGAGAKGMPPLPNKLEYPKFTDHYENSKREFAWDLLPSTTTTYKSAELSLKRVSANFSYNYVPHAGKPNANVAYADGHVELIDINPTRAIPIPQPNPTPLYFFLPRL